MLIKKKTCIAKCRKHLECWQKQKNVIGVSEHKLNPVISKNLFAENDKKFFYVIFSSSGFRRCHQRDVPTTQSRTFATDALFDEHQ